MTSQVKIAKTPMVVLFGGWGREQTVIKLIESGFNIAGVITPAKQSERLQTSIDRIEKSGIKTISGSKSSLSDVLAPFTDHILISIGFPYLLSEEILSWFKIALNMHPTLLPRYRGPTTLAYVILNGEKETGSTVHIIDAGMDTGPIVLQHSVEVTPFDTLRSLQRKVYSIEPDLLIDALKLMDSPDFAPQVQDEKQATVFSKKRTPSDSEINPEKSLLDLYDEIRACDPEDFPAFFFVEGQKVCIRLWWPDLDSEEKKEI